MAARLAIVLIVAGTGSSWAAPPGPLSDVPWLPVRTGTVSVRLAPGPIPTDLERVLAQGWQLGGSVSERVSQVRRANPGLPDPTRIWRLPARLTPAVASHPAVESLWGHPSPVAPPDDPADRPPTTPDFTAEQTWRTRFGVAAAAWWPDGSGARSTVFDVEYATQPLHEDLVNTPLDVIWGDPTPEYAFHGTSVIGIVAAAGDGFGTTGGAPQADVVLSYPVDGERFDIAEAILQAVAAGDPGDVILVEMQIGTELGLGPASADPATWDAMAVAVAAGLVVVEPAGNGEVDLDDPTWDGWWDAEHDSGSILVGAVDPATGAWTGRSGFGSRVDLHGDNVDILAPTTDGFEPDRFWPDRDDLQAYTSQFGGTSGAAAQVAGLVAAAQGVAKAVHGAPVEPRQLRSWMIASGQPQAGAAASESQVGVRPDLRRLLRTWLSP